MYERVIIPTDGSNLSFKGVQEGLEAAATYDIPAVAIYVIPPHPLLSSPKGRYRSEEFEQESIDALSEQAKKEGQDILQKVVERAEKYGIEIKTVIREGEPYEEITEIASENDIVYIASHGRSGLSSVFLGSTTDRVLKHTDSTVAVVKRKE